MTADNDDPSDALYNLPTLSLPMAPVKPRALWFEHIGGFWDVLNGLGIGLVLSRERENFLQFLGAPGGQPWQSAFSIEQPTGLFYDAGQDRLIVGTTRTPNQIVTFRGLHSGMVDPEILPDGYEAPGAGTGRLYIPTLTHFLPGALYCHDVVRFGADTYVIATDHNFLARLEPEGGWRRVWWPKALDQLATDQFRINRMQINAIAVNTSPDDSYYSAFCDEMTGAKPWRTGFGPAGRGVVISGATRETILRGLTCPHSVRLREARLWVCNSGYGELVVTGPFRHDGALTWEPVTGRMSGYARGLCFAGDYAFVGLSKVTPGYERYAPGVDAATSRCGIVAIHRPSGSLEAELWWPDGHEIYDIQVLPGVIKPTFPDDVDKHGANADLRYLG